jgi:hypothetical protein
MWPTKEKTMFATIFSKFGAYIVGAFGVVAAVLSLWFGAKKAGEGTQKASDAVAQEAASVESARVAAVAETNAASTATAVDTAVAAEADTAVTATLLGQFSRD